MKSNASKRKPGRQPRSRRTPIAGRRSPITEYRSLITGLLLAALCLLSCGLVHAFPPAPPHTFYGMVRDEWGNPLSFENAEVILETSSGVFLRSGVRIEPVDGLNYELKAPMDSGIAGDAYKPTALKPAASFRMKVKVGSQVYLPIEMVGNIGSLGLPGKSTRLDLTLGVDSDGDGLPDAWERALIQSLGLSGLGDVNPNDDSDGDGLSNLDEYILGSYAFDPENGFALDVVAVDGDAATLEFLAIKGRSYTIECSADLKSWAHVEFQLSTDTADDALRMKYAAKDVRNLQVRAPHGAGSAAIKFYRLMVR